VLRDSGLVAALTSRFRHEPVQVGTVGGLPLPRLDPQTELVAHVAACDVVADALARGPVEVEVEVEVEVRSSGATADDRPPVPRADADGADQLVVTVAGLPGVPAGSDRRLLAAADRLVAAGGGLEVSPDGTRCTLRMPVRAEGLA
jgi:hypothetical protein